MVRGAETEKVFGTEDAAVGGRLTDASAKASPFSSMRPPRSSRDRIAASPLATSSGDASVAAVPPPVAFLAEDPSEHARVRRTLTPTTASARVNPVLMTILAVPREDHLEVARPNGSGASRRQALSTSDDAFLFDARRRRQRRRRSEHRHLKSDGTIASDETKTATPPDVGATCRIQVGRTLLPFEPIAGLAGPVSNSDEFNPIGEVAIEYEVREALHHRPSKTGICLPFVS